MGESIPLYFALSKTTGSIYSDRLSELWFGFLMWTCGSFLCFHCSCVDVPVSSLHWYAAKTRLQIPSRSQNMTKPGTSENVFKSFGIRITVIGVYMSFSLSPNISVVRYKRIRGEGGVRRGSAVRAQAPHPWTKMFWRTKSLESPPPPL